MKALSPKDAEHLGKLLNEIGEIFDYYEIPAIVAFRLDENKSIFSCSGNVPEISYQLINIVRELSRHWNVKKEYFTNIIKDFT